MACVKCSNLFFFFNDPAPPEIYTLSLHDALPIYTREQIRFGGLMFAGFLASAFVLGWLDRKSTRLNSSHGSNSHAVFCLKKKNSAFPLPERHSAALLPSSDHDGSMLS